MHFEERATQEESRVPLRSRNVALTSSLPNIVDPELAALRRRHHFAPQQRHHHPHFQYGEMTEEVSAPQHRDAQYRYRLKAKQSLLVPKSTSTQEVHRSVTYMPQFPPQSQSILTNMQCPYFN